MNTSEQLVENLERFGVKRIFGYPGGRAIELFDLLPESDIDLTHPRDEREASVMAEMHGRLTGEPGVLAGQGPWIGSLSLIGQMEARLASSPVVTITETFERETYSTLMPCQQSHSDYDGLELPKILDVVTKKHWSLRVPTETARGPQLAFKHAATGRPGPMAVILDGDAITEPFPDESVPAVWDDGTQTRTWTAAPTARDIAAAAEALDAAERPIIVSGNGVHASGTYDELAAVAEACEATVITSYLEELTFPETHRLAGGVIGSFGHEGANRLVSKTDTLPVVDCHVNPMGTNQQAPDFIRPNEQTTTHTDIDPRNAGWVYPADVGLIGDASESLRELTTAGGTDSDRAKDRAREARESFYAPKCGSDTAPILPQRTVRRIERVVDEDTVVTASSRDNRFWLLNYLQVPAVQTYYGSNSVSSMRWTTLATVSAALATDEHVVGAAGDGSFAMTMTSIETAVKHGAAPTFVVLNDTSLGMIRQMQHVSDDITGVEFYDTDFARVVEAFGATGVRVETPGESGDVLAGAKTHGLPAVIDARINRSQDMAATFQSSFYASVGGFHG